MAAEYFLAWITEPVAFDEATHAVKDEKIIWLNRGLVENDFPTLSIIVPKPDSELLSVDRKRWAWVSYRKIDGTIVPLFLGWLLGIPEDSVGPTVKLLFISKPLDFDAQQKALADSLKVGHWFDPAFVKPEAREDPDMALQSRAAVWSMSHLYPLTVGITSLLEGEDGHITFQSGVNVPYDSVRREFGDTPVRRVKFRAEAYWRQNAAGEVDLKVPIIEAFAAAGTTEPGMATSFTGQGLADDWPKWDDNIGSGWTVKEAGVTYVKQTTKEVSLSQLPVSWSWKGTIWSERHLDPTLLFLRSLSTVPGDAIFYLWFMAPWFIAKYKASRRRSEIVTFTLEADLQPIEAEPEDEGEEEITITAPDLNELVDEGGTVAPIRDERRNSYFKTGRGKRSLEFLMAVASRRIIESARCVHVTFTVPFEDGIDVTCRKTATLVDSRFPGGATGKIISSSLLANPANGEFSCTITIACSVGEGNIVEADPGVATYIEDGYIDETYYVREGASFNAVDSRLVYHDFTDAPIDDDGIDFWNMTHHHVVESCEVFNGEAVQTDVLNGFFEEIDMAADALNEVPTSVKLILKPLEAEFETELPITVTGLMINKTIDLRAVG